MTTEPQKRLISKGKCVYCGKLIAKSGIGRHLQSCKDRQKTIAAANAAKPTRLFHLMVGGLYAIDYWMHIEVAAEKQLKDLDQYLRDTWLECCGHLSQFIINGRYYSVDTGGGFGARSMAVRLDKVLESGMTFHHEYDFGDTTDLVLKVVGERNGTIPKGWLTVMARNEPPPIMCGACNAKLATQVCTMCSYDSSGWLCDTCAKQHSHDEDYFLPVVNSPRTGQCGYTGEAF